ncbi:CHAT domain-containing protein [Streptomyces beijiangensis]|uniref:CHAT domain-containing protein n=1 Tax=Streptomyces beijiangensis TaxID=163361 RepID=A0A939F9I5_9ACTN|nr:CHAT domain-containing protein [Streptomyces beijiangensis]MBO0512955.1 CHAT domain-containing protein [Streptomyces beijiangensis]
MTDRPVNLQIHAQRFDRFSQDDRAEGEIVYSFYADGTFLGRTTVDIGTRRTLLGRLYDLTSRVTVTGWSTDSSDQLARFGRHLYALFFPPEVKRSIFHTSRRGIIALELQDHDVPWELICDEYGFISRRIAFGRTLIRPSKVMENSARKSVCVAVVGDPTQDLPEARREAEEIAEKCRDALAILKQRFSIYGSVRLLLGAEATKEAVLLDLLMDPSQDIDLLHYAGHAKFDPRDPSNSSLPLSDGDFRGFEARNLGCSPFVFVNGCRAAATSPDGVASFGAVSGLAAEFLTGGAVAYIAPLWPVGDAPARRVAQTFYKNVMAGDSAGEAIFAARKSEETPDALAYVLFGDPAETLPIFKPQLTAGPYVNDIGIDRIIQLEREYPGLELLAVNDLPWIIWDEKDVRAWVHAIPMDAERSLRSERALMEYIEEFGNLVESGSKTLLSIVSARVLRGYLASRGATRAQELIDHVRRLSSAPRFGLVISEYEDGEIEEIELVSRFGNIPPDPASSVYVFNKQTRFEDSERTYNLYEDYNPDMIRHYLERYMRLLRRALADYGEEFQVTLGLESFQTINECTGRILHGMCAGLFGKDWDEPSGT